MGLQETAGASREVSNYGPQAGRGPGEMRGEIQAAV